MAEQRNISTQPFIYWMDQLLVRVWCRSGVVRLGGQSDGCQWAGYRRLPDPTAKPCPRCGSEVVR